MQVDLPSPRQPLRMSHKRVRSASPSPTSYEHERASRPTKRPTLALRIGSVDGIRREKNDWVWQTGSLHISSPPQASPSLGTGTALSATETNPNASPMLTDNEPFEPPTLQITPAPLQPPSHYMRLDSPPPTSQRRNVLTHNHDSLQPPNLSVQTSQISARRNWEAPDIRILPATPSSRFGGANSAPPSPMLVSPVVQAISSPTSPNSRKPKLTIGPRTDCIKCRDGVKGHWMHFD